MRLLVPLAFLLTAIAAPASAADKLRVILDWFVNPDHAPLVIAQERDIFAAHGLDVELIPPADPNDPPKLVAAGQADIAVGYQPQLHLQVAEGLPLVRIGTLIATPLNTIITLADGPVRGLGDLKGRRIGYSVGATEEALLRAILSRHRIGLDEVELINVNFSLSPALLSGQVDAVIGGYRNFEMHQLAIAGQQGRAFFVEEEGVPAYDELIYVANRASVDRPELRRFLEAVEEATHWLGNHPGEAWEIFKTSDEALDDEINARAWNDTWPRFTASPAALDWRRYDRFAAFLEEQKLIERSPPVQDYAVDLWAKR